MEGTSDAADRVVFREMAREAVLQGGDASRSSPGQLEHQDPPQEIRWSSVSNDGHHELATRGARAERVGAKLSTRVIAGEAPGLGLRARDAAPGPRHLGWLLARVRASRVATRCSGRRSKGRHHERGCAPGRPGAGSSGAWTSVVVLVDRFGCRSRFEASGPTPPTGDESVTRPGSSVGGASRRREPMLEAAPFGGQAAGLVAGSRKPGCGDAPGNIESMEGALSRGGRRP